MNVGIIGAGNISETHARAARAAGLTVAAVTGANEGRTRTLAERYGAVGCRSLDELLRTPLDLVLIGSPSGRHAEDATAAARAGLHVLVEKPLDITTARVDALVAETDRAGVQLGVFYQDRLKPDVVALKRLVDAGELGTVVLATADVKWSRPPEYYSGSRWRGTWGLDGGGALMNQGIHTVDLLLWLLGPAVRVSGVTATRAHRIEAEDTATALIEFESGVTATLVATTAASPGQPRRIEIVGTQGTASLDGDSLRRPDTPTAAPLENAASPVVSDATAHQRIIEDFVRAIATGARPACDGREGRRSVALVEAVYRSSRTRTVVTLDA
jgi:predicted dehydrogenase